MDKQPSLQNSHAPAYLISVSNSSLTQAQSYNQQDSTSQQVGYACVLTAMITIPQGKLSLKGKILPESLNSVFYHQSEMLSAFNGNFEEVL